MPQYKFGDPDAWPHFISVMCLGGVGGVRHETQDPMRVEILIVVRYIEPDGFDEFGNQDFRDYWVFDTDPHQLIQVADSETEVPEDMNADQRGPGTWRNPRWRWAKQKLHGVLREDYVFQCTECGTRVKCNGERLRRFAIRLAQEGVSSIDLSSLRRYISA